MEAEEPIQDCSSKPRAAEVERRLASIEARVEILSKAVGLASLREVDLLRHLGLSAVAAMRDAADLLALIGETEDENASE
jgi:hypothetical protein